MENKWTRKSIRIKANSDTNHFLYDSQLRNGFHFMLEILQLKFKFIILFQELTKTYTIGEKIKSRFEISIFVIGNNVF